MTRCVFAGTLNLAQPVSGGGGCHDFGVVAADIVNISVYIMMFYIAAVVREQRRTNTNSSFYQVFIC